MNNYDIIEFDFAAFDISIRKEISKVVSELQHIKTEIDALDLVIRGGFITDILSERDPKDVDIFYVLKDKQGNPDLSCHCDEIKDAIVNLDLELIGKKYKVDVGHYGNNEFYIPVIEKICGFFSHHADFYSMFVLTPEGKIYTNKMGKYCFDNKIYEQVFNTWPMTQNFLDNHIGNYYDSYNGFTFRGVRQMIRKNLVPGEVFITMLNNWLPILEYSLKDPLLVERMKGRIARNSVRSDQILTILKRFNIKDAVKVFRLLKDIEESVDPVKN